MNEVCDIFFINFTPKQSKNATRMQGLTGSEREWEGWTKEKGQ